MSNKEPEHPLVLRGQTKTIVAERVLFRRVDRSSAVIGPLDAVEDQDYKKRSNVKKAYELSQTDFRGARLCTVTFLEGVDEVEDHKGNGQGKEGEDPLPGGGVFEEGEFGIKQWGKPDHKASVGN